MVALDPPPATSVPVTPSVPTNIPSTTATAAPSGRILSNAHHPPIIQAHPLPSPSPLVDTNFVWGECDSTTFSASLCSAYSEVVHWKRNIFKVPLGRGGKLFVSELGRLFRAYSESSALEPIALKAVTVLSVLALQKPSAKPKTKQLSACLERRMAQWSKGEVAALLEEGRCLQKRLPRRTSSPSSADRKLARTFANLMFRGKTSAALDLLASKGNSGVLHENDPANKDDPASPSVLDVLKSKHPAAQPAPADALISDSQLPSDVHPVVFDKIDAAAIRTAALSTNGAAGPSGLDAHCWRRLCTSFHNASHELCHSLALLARRLCTSFVDPRGLSSFLACRLIALDKCPGVRPIGICETARRIVAKAVLFVTKSDIQEAAGVRQLCGGQIAGIEAAIHSVFSEFQSEASEAVLLVDASNAFNSLNREAALHNIRYVCPPLAKVLTNIYREPTELFADGQTILSQEGTTQGDPFAMPFYALATVPLIRHLDGAEDLKQVWYADDASATGSLTSIRSWWDELASVGPGYGYFANASKTWLVTKESHVERARELFADTDVNITSNGRPYLGVPLGTSEFTKQFIQEKVNSWISNLSLLSDIACAQPHAAYAAFTHGFIHKFSFLCRSVSDLATLLEPLEECISMTFIPALIGRPPLNEDTRALLALPARLGGLGIIDLTRSCQAMYLASSLISAPLTSLISVQQDEYSYDCIAAQLKAKAEVKSLRRRDVKDAASELKAKLPACLQRAVDLAQESGASSWLTSRPIEEFGFTLHKSAFRDAIALRYGWSPLNTPTRCSCGSQFSVQHALSCPKGGFPTLRHNEVRDLTAALMTEVCHDVCVEPHLQPLTGESLDGASAITTDGARLDVAANGFWGGRHERAFFDVRVFNPHAQSNHQPIATCYRKHENTKKRAYEQRVREVEHGSFTPLVLSLTGGMGCAATVCYKRLASLIAQKRDQPYSRTMAWVRCCLSFALLRSSIQCIRGARSSIGQYGREPLPPVDLVTSEANLTV